MPNLLNDFFSGSESFRTLYTLKNDAKKIRSSIMGGFKSTTTTVSEMKRNNVMIQKTIRWFKNQGAEYGDHDTFDEDEFDSNTHQQNTSSVLSAEDYEEIENAKTAEQYTIEKKKLDAKIVSTVEIIDNTNQRTAEIISTLRNSEDIICQISKRLDLIIKYNSSMIDKMNRIANNSIYNSQGMLTIGGVIEYFKQNQSDIAKFSMTSLLKNTILGEVDHQINLHLVNFQNNLLTKFLNIPIVSKFFGLNTNKSNEDYSRFIDNQYTREPVIFDGKTRKTIVDIIPGYLRAITSSLTHTDLAVNQYGNLTTDTSDKFERIIDVTFDLSLFEEKTFSEMIEQSKDKKDYNKADIKEVQRVLISQYVYRSYHNAISLLTEKNMRGGIDRDIFKYIQKILVEEKGKDPSYWESILDMISTKIQLDKHYREKFVSSINMCLTKLDRAGIRRAFITDGSERMILTNEMFERRIRARLSKDSSSFEYDGKTLRQLIKEGIIDKKNLPASELENLDKKITSFEDLYSNLERINVESMGTTVLSRNADMHTIIGDIFIRLNKGINVYTLNPRENTNFDQMSVTKTERDVIYEQKISFSKDSDVSLYQPYYINPIENVISNEASRLKADVNQLIDSAIHHMKDYISPKTDDDQKANETLIYLNAIEKMEEPSDADQATITTKINEVQDPNKKRILKRAADGIIARSKRRKKPKSLLGKALFFVFGLAKSFFSKTFSMIRTFWTSKANIFKTMMDDAFYKIKRGNDAIKEGFLGIGKKLGEKMKDFINSDRDVETRNLSESSYTSETKYSSSKHPSKLLTNIENTLSKNEFGEGFVSAFKSKTKRHSKIVASSLADQKSDSINELIKQPHQTSILGVFVSTIDSITEAAKQWFDKASSSGKSEEQEKQKKQEADKKKQKSFKYDLGKILGGIGGILAGIGQAVLTIVLSLTAVKSIISLVHKTLTSALQPLNKAFQKLYKALKPVMKTVTKVLKQLVEYVSQILIAVIDFIQPLFEALIPMIEQIMDILNPILKMLTGLIKVLLVPLTAILQTVVVPVIQSIGNTIQILTGIVQVAVGTVITGIGATVIAAGILVKWFTGSEKVVDTGKQLFDLGKNMTTSGAENVVSGMKKSVTLTIDTYKNLTGSNNKNEETETQQTQYQAKPESLNGSPMDGIVGAGDANAPYKFDDEVTDALSNLKSIASGMFSMFGASDDADIGIQLDNENDENRDKQLEIEASGLTDDEKKKIDDRAFEIFKQAPSKEQLTGETDQQYRARFEKEKDRYWLKAAAEIVTEKVKSVADGTEEGAVKLIHDALDEEGLVSNFTRGMSAAANDVEYGDFEDIMANWFDSLEYGDDYYYDDDGYYYTGEAGDILTAAAETFVAIEKAAKDHATSTAHSAWISDVTFDDGFTIDQVSMMCTGTQAAIVKRMGYYLPSGGKAYTDTYQGDVGMISANGKNNGWGLENADGHPNIFNRDGTKSEDWVILKNPSDYQPGDISFPSQAINCHDDTLAWHAHMAAYCWNGNWYGFNGSNPLSDNQQEARSLKLAKYYLSHGYMPDEDPSMTDTEVATMSADGYNQGIVIRYVGPKGGRRRVKSGKSRLSNATGGKEDLIRSAAEIFEAYQKTNPALTYSNWVWDKPITTRSGHTRKIRPDCSGTMSAAIQELGYVLKVNGVNPGDEGIRSGTWGTQTKNTLIYDSENAATPSKDWMVLDYAQSKLEPGDITAFPPPPGQVSGHLTMPIADLTTSPKGLDGGGGIAQSPAAAVAYLRGDKNIPWVTNGGMPSMKKIWRFLGGKAESSSNSRTGKRVSTRRAAAGTRTPTLRSTGNTRKGNVSNTRTKSKGGTNAWIETVAKVFEGYYDARNGYPTYNNAGYTTFKTRDGKSVTARTDCSGMITASITAFGYHMKDEPYVCHNTIARSPLENNFIYDDANCTKLSKDWIVKSASASDMQPGDITSSGGHISFPIVVSNPYSLKGLDAGGTNNLVKSGKAAKAYLNGESDPQWYWAMGTNDGAVRTIRYVGKSGKSSGSSKSTKSSNKSSSSKKSSSKRKTVTAKAAKNGKYTSVKMDPIRAGAEVFYYSWIANDKKPLLWNGTSLLNGIKFPDGFVIDKISYTFCMSMMAAIVKRMGYYLPSGGKAYTSTYQGNDYMRATIGGGSESWGMDNSDGRPNIFDKNGKKSKDWKIIYPSDGVQPGDIWFAGRGTNVHGHQPIFKGSGQWLGFNGGRNDSMVNSVRLAEYYLENNQVPPASSPSIQSEGYYYDKQTGAITYAPMTFGVRFVGNAKSVKTTGTRSNVKVTSGKKKTKKKTTAKKKGSKSKKNTKSSKLLGNTVEAQIYNYMTKNKGMSGVGAAGMMGCMKYESGLQPNNLENSYNTQFGLTDEQYTSRVDNKQESKKNFIYGRYATCRSGQIPGEAVGYGLTQFTSSNLKKELYENSVEKGKSIADVGAQLDSVTNTLKQSKVGNVSLFQKISNSKTPTEANQWFLWRYEAGTGYNSDEAVLRAYPWMARSDITDRHTAAETYYKQLRGSGDAEDVGYVPEFYDPAPMEEFMKSLDRTDGSHFVSPMYIPPIGANPMEDILPYDEESQPLIVNKYETYTEMSLLDYIDTLLVNDYNVESPNIRSLVTQIFEEFPEYIEDDEDDDDFSYEDDLVIQQLAGLLT